MRDDGPAVRSGGILLHVAPALRLIGAIDEAPVILTSVSGVSAVAGFVLGIAPSARLLISHRQPLVLLESLPKREAP